MGQGSNDEGSFSPASIFIDLKWHEGHCTLPSPLVQIHGQICDWTWKLKVFCYVGIFLIFTVSTWILICNLGQLFPSIGCLELVCLCNASSHWSQQILSQPHLAKIPELSHTFFQELPETVSSMDEDQLIKKHQCNSFAFEKAGLLFALPLKI